jgi:hypothetical protein
MAGERTNATTGRTAERRRRCAEGPQFMNALLEARKRPDTRRRVAATIEESR